MNELFWLKKLISIVALPPAGPLLLALLAVLFLGRTRRLPRAVALLSIVALLALGMPAVSSHLTRPLEDFPVFDPASASEAGAIVVLGAGARRNAPEYGGETVNYFSLERLRYGAQLARITKLPVLVTGGAPAPGLAAEATLMRRTLEEDFNVPVRWVEDLALDTRDNARLSAEILGREGIRKVVLVTHAFHMRRAVGEFADAGLEAIPAVTGHLTLPPEERREAPVFFDYLPQGDALGKSLHVLREQLGDLVRRLRPS